MEWNEELAVGIQEIDEQHRQIIRLFNEAIGLCYTGADRAAADSALDNLGAYIIEHFCVEERMLRAAGDPGYEDHKKKHDDFVIRFQALRGRFDEEGPSPTVALTLTTTLASWLLDHFKTTDRGLVNCLVTTSQQGPYVHFN